MSEEEWNNELDVWKKAQKVIQDVIESAELLSDFRAASLYIRRGDGCKVESVEITLKV